MADDAIKCLDCETPITFTGKRFRCNCPVVPRVSPDDLPRLAIVTVGVEPGTLLRATTDQEAKSGVGRE